MADVETASRRLRALRARALQLGVPAAEYTRLAAGRRRAAAEAAAAAATAAAGKGSPGAACARGPLLPAALGALCAALALASALGLLSHAGLARAWLRWHRHDLFAEECIVGMPEAVGRAVRPPADCAMCRGLAGVDRVSAISPARFEEQYAYSGRPVVVTDATANWTAPQVFSFAYFRELYARASLEDGARPAHSRSGCQFFPYETEFTHLLEALNMSEERAAMREGERPWYIGWSNCEEAVVRELRRHYSRPYFLPDTAEPKRLDWIFMGSPGYGAHMHVDNVQHPSWQAQLRGRKRWLLQPPPECFYECATLDVTVDTGDILVLDTNRWYHQTTIVSDDMSITVGAEYD